MSEFLVPDWPAPKNVRACTSTRVGGVSDPPYDSFNLAGHVGDDEDRVRLNRQRLYQELSLPAEPLWLDQVHGTRVIQHNSGEGPGEADASVSRQAGQVCAVMTADCLPVLFCDSNGSTVAAAHAGWRGLLAGVLEATVDAMECDHNQLMVWLGPAIGPQHFEVGEEVYSAFVADMPVSKQAFTANRAGHYMADIYQLARLRLQRKAVTQIYGGDRCSYREQDHFYSYRRDGQTGRMVSLIWRAQ